MKAKKKAKLAKLLQTFKKMINVDSDDCLSAPSTDEEGCTSDEDNIFVPTVSRKKAVKERHSPASTLNHTNRKKKEVEEETNSWDEDDPSAPVSLKSAPNKEEVDARTKKLFAKYLLDENDRKPTVKVGTRKRKRKAKAEQHAIGIYTVVLLEDSTRDKPLSGKEYSAHAVKSLVQEPVSLSKSLSAKALHGELRKLFDRLESINFDVLKKHGDKLLPPNLPKGEKLDGKNFSYVFYRKTVFLRPHSCPSPPNVPVDSPGSSTIGSKCASGTVSTARLLVRPHASLALPRTSGEALEQHEVDSSSDESEKLVFETETGNSSGVAQKEHDVPAEEEASDADNELYTVVLLEDSTRDKPLSGKEYSAHAVKSLVQEPVPLSNSLSAEALHGELRKLFHRLESINFDVLKKQGDKLLPPNLPKGGKLDGKNFSYVFNRKTVFLRPHSCLSLQKVTLNRPGSSTIGSKCASGTASTARLLVRPHASLALPQTSGEALEQHEVETIEVDSSSDEPEKPVLELEENNSSMAQKKLDDAPAEEDALDDDNEVYLQQLLLESATAEQSNHMLPENPNGEMYRKAVVSLASAVNIGVNKAIKIMRSRPLQSFLKAMKTKHFSPTKGIFCKIIDKYGVDEIAIDNGGVSKEVFCLVFEQIRLSAVLEGPEYERYLALDNTSLRNKDYYYIGLLIAMAIAHNLPLPQFFSPELYSCIISGNYSRELVIENVMDLEIRNQIMAVEESKDLTALREAVINEGFVGGMGVTVIKIYSEREKRQLFKDALNLALNTRVEPAFRQLLEGLGSLGVLDLLRKKPDIMKCAFVCSKEPLTSAGMKNLFQINWSTLSHEKEQEDNIYLTFINFLDDVEDGNTAVQLYDVLKFTTGYREVPPQGFVPKPVLMFSHNPTGWRPFPEANVCGNVLRLPVCDYSAAEFQEVMEEAIQTKCFGRL